MGCGRTSKEFGFKRKKNEKKYEKREVENQMAKWSKRRGDGKTLECLKK